MSEQTSTINAAVDDVLREIEVKQAAEDLRTATVNRMRAAIHLAVVLTYQREIASASEQFGALALNGAPAEITVPTLEAADAEGRRLLASLGIEWPAPAGGA